MAIAEMLIGAHHKYIHMNMCMYIYNITLIQIFLKAKGPVWTRSVSLAKSELDGVRTQVSQHQFLCLYQWATTSFAIEMNLMWGSSSFL